MATQLLTKDQWVRDHTLSVGSLSNNATKNKSIIRGLAYHRKIYKLLESWRRVSAPDQVLEVEPWLRNLRDRKCCQPDAVLIEPSSQTGLVVEVKLNWKDGRDEKLINLYLEAVAQAFDLRATWPVLITSNVAGLKYKPLLGLGDLQRCDSWDVGDPTPVLLVP